MIAVVGATGLRDVNLGASPAVKNGFDHPTSDVWTLPDQVQVVGVAPIRSGDQTPALLVKGLPLGRSQLATVGTSLGVYPAAALPELALRAGACLAVMNAEETPFDDLATFVVREQLGQALPAVVELV